MWQRQRGMTLLETLIVIGLAVAVISGIVALIQRQSDKTRSEDAVRVQGQEIANVAAAMRQYAETVGHEMGIGELRQVEIQALIDRGLLPEQFAFRTGRRGEDIGVTPVGQAYVIASIKDGGSYDDPDVADGTIRSVIYEMNTPLEGRLERAGVVNLPQAILAYKEAVGIYTTREEKLPMGVMEAGGETVRGVGLSFTKDLIDWIGNPPETPMVVALVGFPDLDGLVGIVTPPPAPTVAQYDDCLVVSDEDGCGGYPCHPWSEPFCPSGYEQLATPTLCGGGGTRATSTDVGMVIAGQATEANTAGYSGCTASSTTTVFATVTVGGGEMFRQQCSQRLLSSQMVQPPPDFVRQCVTQTQTSESRTSGVASAYGLLCCHPRPQGE